MIVIGSHVMARSEFGLVVGTVTAVNGDMVTVYNGFSFYDVPRREITKTRFGL